MRNRPCHQRPPLALPRLQRCTQAPAPTPPLCDLRLLAAGKAPADLLLNRKARQGKSSRYEFEKYSLVRCAFWGGGWGVHVMRGQGACTGKACVHARAGWGWPGHAWALA